MRPFDATFMGRGRRWPGLAALPAVGFLLATGCAHPGANTDPFRADKVEAALQPQPLDRLQVAAAKIEHPLLPPLVIDGRDGFSPGEVAVMSVLASPRLRALRDQRGLAQAQVLQAGILPNPQLGYSLDHPHGNADTSLVTGKSLGVSWDFTSLLGRTDRVASARAAAGALDLEIAWQEWQTAQGARLNAFRLLALQQRLPLLRQIEDDLAATLSAHTQALALGGATAVDLSLSTERWRAAQENRRAAEQESRIERSALNLALGLAAEAELALKPAPMFPALPPDATPAVWLEGLEKRRLDLVALTLGYESNEASLRAAVKTRFPRIGLSFAKVNDTSNVRTQTTGVTVDLPLFDRNQGAVATGQATRQQLFDDYVARVAEARADVALIFANLAAARTRLQAAGEALPEWVQLDEASAQAFATRNIDAVARREARATLASRRLEQVNLQQQVAELEVALEVATGRPWLNVNPPR